MKLWDALFRKRRAARAAGRPSETATTEPRRAEVAGRWRDSKLYDPNRERRREVVMGLNDQPLLATVAREDPDWWVRETAVERITVPGLLMQLAMDQDLVVAANAVLRIEEGAALESLIPEVLPRLLKGLGDASSSVSVPAKKALLKIGDAAVEGLQDVAVSASSNVTRSYARSVLEGIRTPRAREAIHRFKNLDAHAQDSEEFRVLRAYWRACATEYWQSRLGEAVCDSCNDGIPRGNGYLHGSHLNCEDCCHRMLGADALEALRKDPDYFGPGEFAAARKRSGT